MKNLRRLYSKLNRHRNNVKKRSIEKSKQRVGSSKAKFKRSGLIKQYDVSTATQSELEERSTGGYIELDKGFIIQWGRVLHKGDEDEQPNKYKFEKKFQHACFSIVLNMQESGANYATNATYITAFGFEIDSDKMNMDVVETNASI